MDYDPEACMCDSCRLERLLSYVAKAEREAFALHSALAEACKRIATANQARGRQWAFKDLLAVLKDPDNAPRLWEAK